MAPWPCFSLGRVKGLSIHFSGTFVSKLAPFELEACRRLVSLPTSTIVGVARLSGGDHKRSIFAWSTCNKSVIAFSCLCHLAASHKAN